MNQTYFKKYQKPNYNDIQKAKNEDQEAIQKIISIYQPYIYI
ncbi:helix-turn-helix domain-containing protein, partial [Holdemanella porci]